MSGEYRVVARIKNGRLWGAIMVAYPDVRNQADAARRLGLSPATLGGWLNMSEWPGNRSGGWQPVAQRVAAALRETPDYLFDGELYGRRMPVVAQAVDRELLMAHGLLLPPATPLELAESAEDVAALRHVWPALRQRERRVLTLLYGLETGTPLPMAEVAAMQGTSASRISQIHGAALRHVRAQLAWARRGGEHG